MVAQFALHPMIWFISFAFGPLHLAAWMDKLIPASASGHLDVVKALLESNANANPQTKLKLSPLTIATQKGYTAVADLLKQHGAV